MTALAQPWHDVIFAGQGPILKIFDRVSTTLIYSERIFGDQAIHGFATLRSADNSSVLLVAWGGRIIFQCLVTREENSKSQFGYAISAEQQQVIKSSDWIFDIRFKPQDSTHPTSLWTAALVNAHNEIFQLSSDKITGDGEDYHYSLRLRKLFSGPKCGLYSAALEWLTAEHLLVISGTAFGEIVVWSLRFQQERIKARRHYVFTGHEGSVFGVRVSGELHVLDNVRARLLASCSDDRTIRLWDISNLEEGLLLGKDDMDESDRDASRTTGFLNYVSEEAAEASSKLCVATGMGHLSRIWGIKFAEERSSIDEKEYICSLVSVGEDASCQTWCLSQHNGSLTLTHSTTSAPHEGKNIWSMCVTSDRSLPCILTGGADGKIIEHDRLAKPNNEGEHHVNESEWGLDDVLGQLQADSEDSTLESDFQPEKRPKGKSDSFRSFAAIGNSQLLITTNEGLVLLATSSATNEWSWKHIASFDGLKGYSVSCHLVADPFEYVLFGDSRGNIYYYHSFFEEIKLLTSIEGKITRLMAEILPLRTHEYMSIVVTRHGGHPPVQLRVNLGTGGTIWLSSTKTFARWTPDFPQITSAVVATHDSAEKGLIVGCRNGTIYSYSRPEAPGKREFDFELPLSHGKEAVTAMTWLPHKGHQDNMWNPSFGWLFSVGRDGTLAVHHFEGFYADPVLVHKLSLSFGPNLEGIAIDPTTLDVTVWGFTSKFFISQNVSGAQDVVTVECGGAHRIWNFAPLDMSADGNRGGLFAWIKAMRLNLARLRGTNHKVIQSGGHGREIKTSAAATRSIHPALGPLVATGAEDTDIAISYYADWHTGQTQLKQVAVLRKHVTGVQSLHWSSDGHFLFSCGGFEEFYVWRLRPVPAISVGVACESKCPLEKPDSELRITDFSVRDVVVQEQGHLGDEVWIFLISMIYSDSSIKVRSFTFGTMPFTDSRKVWRYTSTTSVVPDRQAWSFVASTNYTTACLTTASFLSTNTTGWPLVTGATDGHLLFWSLSDEKRNLKCERVQSLHQNSIKAMSVLELSDTSWMVATGGDDNALAFTIVTYEDEAGWYDSSSLIVPSAHAAGITALAVLDLKSNEMKQRSSEVLIVSASNDQVIKLWAISIDTGRSGTEGLKVKKAASYTSAVADVSSVAVFSTNWVGLRHELKVVISGVGTEVWSIA